MPSPAYFSEPMETAALASGRTGQAVQVQAAVKAKALSGSGPAADSGLDESAEISPQFSQVLRHGLGKKNASVDADTEEVAVPGSMPGVPSLQGMAENTTLAAAQTAFLGYDQGPTPANAATTTAIAGTPRTTTTTTTATVNARTQMAATTMATTAAGIPLASSTPATATAGTQTVVHQGKNSDQILGFMLPSSSANVAEVGAKHLSVAQAEATQAANGSAVENTRNSEPGPGAKLKLDFSVFDAAFPEGWQALLVEERAEAPVVKAAVSGNGQAGKASPALSLSSDSKASSGVQLAQKSGITGGAEAGQPQLDLNVQPLAATASPGNTHAQAQNTEAAAKGGLPSLRSEKNAEPVSARTDLSTTMGAESLAGPAEAKSTSATAATVPGQLFSRLTDLQRQMVVEQFSQSAVPAFQGKHETLTVDLNPPELGRVQVQVEKTSNGNGVNAVLTVQDRSVGELFQGQTDLIRKTLEDAGIHLGGLSVEIRQQFNQTAGEKSATDTEKYAGRESGGSTSRTVESRRKSSSWGLGGLSRVDMMV